MISETERLDSKEQRNSLAAFLRSIKFRKPSAEGFTAERPMARLHPRTPQSSNASDDQNCVRSAN